MNLSALLSFLNSLPLIRNLPKGAKKFLGDVLTVCVALSTVLAIVIAVGPSFHVSIAEQADLVTGASILAAAIAQLRRQLQTKAAKQAAM
jgi:hypothetical protein